MQSSSAKWLKKSSLIVLALLVSVFLFCFACVATVFSPYVIVSVAEQLGQAGPASSWAVPGLILLLEHGPNDFDDGDGICAPHGHVALALGKIGDERAVDPLINSVGKSSHLSSSVWFDVEALRLLGVKAHRAAPYLIPLLSNNNDLVRVSAIQALGEIGNPIAIPNLVAALNRPKDAYQAACALSKFGKTAKDAVPKMISIYSVNPDQPGGDGIYYAIEKIAGKEAVLTLKPSYNRKNADISTILMRIFRCPIKMAEQKIVGRISPHETISITLDKQEWLDKHSFKAIMLIEKNGKIQSKQTFANIDLLKQALIDYRQTERI